MTNSFSQPTGMGLSQNSVDYNNGMATNSFSQISNSSPVFMNTLNVPNIQFGELLPNMENYDNDKVDEHVPLGHNNNCNFASM